MRREIYIIVIILGMLITSQLSAIEYLWNTMTLYDGLIFYGNKPTIYNGNVAYGANYGAIYFWDGNQTLNICSYGIGLSLHNGNIAWYGSANDYNIFMWNGFEVTQITHDNNINGFPSAWENTVAWGTGYEDGNINNDIYYYNGSAIQQITSTVDTEFYDGYPSLWNGKIAWARGSSLGSQIMLWDGANIFELTALSDHDHLPSLYNGTIAFSRGNGEDSHIMFWDGTTVSEITQYTSYMNVEPRVALWEDMIVWPGYDGHDTEIFLWDGYEVHQVTDNDVWEYDPDICIQGRQIQITYVETDNINENVLTRVKYVTTYYDPTGQVPEPSQLVFGLFSLAGILQFMRKRSRT